MSIGNHTDDLKLEIFPFLAVMVMLSGSSKKSFYSEDIYMDFHEKKAEINNYVISECFDSVKRRYIGYSLYL